MTPPIYRAPGVYVQEQSAFPNAVAQVSTAIPAFIGYTAQATFQGTSYTNVAKKISSFLEFQRIYGFPDPLLPADHPAKQYSPQYYLVKQNAQPTKGDYIQIGTDFYSIVPDAYTIYYLYNSIKLFYNNGGGDAYIVSVGTYGKASKQPMKPGDPIVNPNVKLNDLLAGLEILKTEPEPTLYICPEATLLSVANNGTLIQSMLLQNSEMKSAISILDVIHGNDPDPVLWMQDIETFRNHTGQVGLDYGVAYYPFIGTTCMQNTDLDYTNLFSGDLRQLALLLNPRNSPNPNAVTIIKNIENPIGNPLTVAQNNNALLVASPTYQTIIQKILEQANILPASGAMAGVITQTDNARGVWKAPANTSITGAVSLPIKLSDSDQSGLNIAVSGKSINAIRFFTGKGILVWGARTLDGNDNEWRYISVRRTAIMIEQSCKLALKGYVFERNEKNTWDTVKMLISNFLNSLFRDGGLAGAKASDAFFVKCGLGETMTAADISNGVMLVELGFAPVRPAEFIILRIQQKMSESS